MNERFKQIWEKILAFWNKYDKKQKTLIVSVTLTLIIALVILALVLSKKTYEELITCEDTVAAASVTDTLTSNSIEYNTSKDGLTIYVEDSEIVRATYLISQAGLTATGYTIDNYIANMGFSTTSEDRERLWQKVIEDKIKETLESFDYVKNAYVQMTVPSNKLSVLDDQEETHIAVKLTLSGTLPDGAADSMAKYLSTAVGNPTTGNITIIDSKGNTLFEGQETVTSDGSISTSVKNQIYDRFYNETVSKISKALATTQMFNTITVAPNLVVNYSKEDVVDTKYYNDDEVLHSEYNYEATGVSGSGGVPGTDTNGDDTTYYIQNDDGSTSTVTINKREYAVSSTVTHKEGDQGTLQREESSVSVVVNKDIIYNYDKLNDAGELDDVTWDEYKASHSEVTPLEVPEGLIGMIADTTGIPEDKITILYYQVPLFEEADDSNVLVENVLPIVLALIILGLLGFVVFRSLKPVEVNEVEPELSVEELLTATKEKQVPIEDIDLEEKSETRKAIEKFVDENPEAVALLLRNWLNDDWN